MSNKSTATGKPILIDLALQGGGAHGAYTWGVLDRLLDEPMLLIEGISGTSAGSMNAAVLASGYTEGGAEGARKALTAFWQRVSETSRLSPFQRGYWDIISGNWTLDNSPLFIGFDLLSRFYSPYDLNPAALNPLRDILKDSINFPVLAESPIKLFITATKMKELRMLALLKQTVSPGSKEGTRWAQMRIHRIASPKMVELGYSSKLNAEWSFLRMLFEEGRRCASTFLNNHRKDLNKRSTFDLDALL